MDLQTFRASTRQIVGALNTLPRIESDDVKWLDTLAKVVVYRKSKYSCCTASAKVMVAEWSVDDGFIIMDSCGFEFSSFVLDLPVGDYEASVQLSFLDAVGVRLPYMAMFKMVFSVEHA